MQSAPRSVRSIGMSALSVSHRDHSIQMKVSARDNSIQIEVEKVSNQMQTTQQHFTTVAIETDPVEEELEVDIDMATQTDQIGLWFLKRCTTHKYLTFEEYLKYTSSD